MYQFFAEGFLKGKKFEQIGIYCVYNMSYVFIELFITKIYICLTSLLLFCFDLIFFVIACESSFALFGVGVFMCHVSGLNVPSKEGQYVGAVQRAD